MRFEYDCQIVGRTVGTYLLEDDGSELRQRVDFETDDGELYRSEHLVGHREGRPVAYRAGTAEWVDCSHMPASHWPTAAYPLLLEARVTEHMAIDEETGEVAPRTLEYAEGRVEERQADRLVRAFDLRDGNVVRIDSGGAISELQSVHPGELSGVVGPTRKPPPAVVNRPRPIQPESHSAPVRRPGTLGSGGQRRA